VGYRERIRSFGFQEGHITYLQNGVPYTSLHNQIVNTESKCSDIVGQRSEDHALEIIHHRQSCDPLVGTLEGYWGTVFSDYPPDCFPRTANPLYLPLPNAPNSRVLATEALARSNPSRPVVDTPVFLAEMRELPDLFRIAGKTLLKKGANAYLSWNYGWKPLLSDLSNYLDFQAQVAKREDELKRLYSNGGLKRRVTLDKAFVHKIDPNFWIQSQGAIVTGTASTTSKREIWATCRWLPDIGSVPNTDMTRHQLARNLVFGLQKPGLKTAWDALPWSWLIDWGTTVGDFLAANRNSVGAHHVGNINVMTRTVTRTEFSRTGGPAWLSGGNGFAEIETKSRAVETGPSLETNLTFLSNWQMSILGAIGISRMRGRL